jgi:23S rRNA (adenine2030-N6)-methyltransferase
VNYRHAYHAGNFADVVKHAALGLVLRHLSLKPAAWRFIDTHAGIGLYELGGDEATRTDEWRSGIGRLAPMLGLELPAGEALGLAPARPLSPDARRALEPYAAALAAANPDGRLRRYPGSPAIARALARRQDRLTLCELHPADGVTLADRYAGDQNVKVIALDGWLAPGAFVPPKERRGVVLLDPPFEEAGEFDRLAAGLIKAHRRWPTGIYMLWHPIKETGDVVAYDRALADAGIPRMLRAEFFIRERTGVTFDGCGLTIVNPPYTLEADLRALLPALASVFAQGPGARFGLNWLTRENL